MERERQPDSFGKRITHAGDLALQMVRDARFSLRAWGTWALEFPYTNESLDAIVTGLDVQPDDAVVAVCGSGDQSFALLQRAKYVVSADTNECQIELAKLRSGWLRLGRADKFLSTYKIHYYGSKAFAARNSPFDQKALQARNAYFNQEGRLGRIASKLGRLHFVEGDIFKLAKVGFRGLGPFSKVYLSNVIGYGLSDKYITDRSGARGTWEERDAYKERAFANNLDSLAQYLPVGGLVYLSYGETIAEVARMAGNDVERISQPSLLEVCERLTGIARERELEGLSKPIVYRRI